MVLLNLTVRPTTAYNAPNKIREVAVDTSQRVEDIVAELKLEKKGTFFYSNGRELPLNSAVASHNIQDRGILESCACPKFSAVLSAVLRDLDAVDKLAEEERMEENVRPLLDGAVLEPWPERWSVQSIKSRKICLATIKKVIQRNDRFQDTQVPPCHNLQELCDFMQTIWRTGEGNRSHNSNAHIVKASARNRDGQPSICWELLQNKLDKLHAIASRAGPNEDPLEEFVKADYARHHTNSVQSTPRGSNKRQRASGGSATPQSTRSRRKLVLEPSPSRNASAVCSTCDSTADSLCLAQGCPFYKLVSCTNCFRGNHPILQRNHERVPLTDPRARKETREQNRLPYVPEYSSGPYAILATLVEVSQEDSPTTTTREFSLSESRLKKLAQQRCRSNLYDHQARGRNAFACVESLVDKGLVRKELIPGLSEAKFSLLLPGEDVGRCCLQFERALNRMLQTPTVVNEQRSALGAATSGIQLLIDRREDATYAERLVDRCLDKGINTSYRELPAGDYLFVTTDSQDQEIVLPLIIERKSWSDLADSVTGRGQRRLDCVRLDGDRQCSGSCQLCRMKRSGCSKIMFIIEGARCLDCTPQSRCKYCRELVERHGPNVVHESLEVVLKKLQLEHDCLIHFTRGFNETIESLMTIREIISEMRVDGQDSRGKAQTYEQFCSNARTSADGPSLVARSSSNSKGAATIVEADSFARKIHEGKIQDFLATVGGGPAGGAEAVKAAVLEINSESDDEVVILDNIRPKKKTKIDKTKVEVLEICSDDDDDDDDDDDVVVLDNLPPSSGYGSSRKRKRPLAPKSTLSLILLSRMYEYDKEFLEDINKVWKATFHASRSNNEMQQEFEAFASGKLDASGLFHKESSPLVQRGMLMFWCLFAQLRMQVRLTITRTHAEMCSIRDGWQQEPQTQPASIPPARRTLHFEETTSRATSTCMMCRGEIVGTQGIQTPCHHLFHRECLSTWIRSSGKRNCPHCNYQGIGLPKDHRATEPSRRHQERPPRPPDAGTHATPGSTTAGIREARLRRFGCASELTPVRSTTDAVKKSSPGVWKCGRCTLENDASSPCCQVCTSPRTYESKPADVTSSASFVARTGWICDECTLENPVVADRCEACSARNPFLATSHGGTMNTGEGLGVESLLSTPTPVGASASSVTSGSTSKKISCGACGQQGHNRASATPVSCPAYHYPEEVERRAKKKTEAERKAREKREEAVQFEQHTQNNLQVAAIREQEIRRLLEVSEQQSATIREMSQAEAKRKQQAARRAELRARRL